MSPGALARSREDRAELHRWFWTAAVVVALCVLGVVHIAREFWRAT